MATTRRSACTAIAAAIALPQSLAWADDDHRDHGRHRDDDGDGLAVTVSFGVGLNTAPLPPDPRNHHVLPKRTRVRKGGVVNFMVAGFHQVWIFLPGKRPDDVLLPAPSALFINDMDRVFYQGLFPAVPGGGPPGGPETVNPSNALNRVESVGFFEEGRYLVICNVQPHFLDGMWGWVIVGGHRHD